jgi:hypothetical protein
MNSFEIEIDEKSRVGSEFMARVVNELRRALAAEKAKRKLTQQNIADSVGTTRAVINRQIQGYENLGARRIAEILWAIGWEPYFEARPIPSGHNETIPPPATVPRESDGDNRKARASALDDGKKNERDKTTSAAELAYAE